MIKKQLAKIISEKGDISIDKSKEVIDIILEVIEEEISLGHRVILNGFGIFERRIRKKRVGRNPRTGEKVEIEEKKVPIFRPGKTFRNKVAGPLHNSKTNGKGSKKKSKGDASKRKVSLDKE